MTKAVLILFAICLIGCATRIVPLRLDPKFVGNQTVGGDDSQIRVAAYAYLVTNSLNIPASMPIFIPAAQPEIEALKVQLPEHIIEPFQNGLISRRRDIFDAKSKAKGIALIAVATKHSDTTAEAGILVEPGGFVSSYGFELEKAQTWKVTKCYLAGVE